MNGVAVEQVKETKLLGITLDCKLSWSKHIDSMVVKMGRVAAAFATYNGDPNKIPKYQILSAPTNGVGAGAGTDSRDWRDCTFPSQRTMVTRTLSIALPSLERQSS